MNSTLHMDGRLEINKMRARKIFPPSASQRFFKQGMGFKRTPSELNKVTMTYYFCSFVYFIFYLRRDAPPTAGEDCPLRWATLARCALSKVETARSINTTSGLWTSSDVALALWTETREKNSCIRLSSLGNPSTKAWSKNCDAMEETHRKVDTTV